MPARHRSELTDSQGVSLGTSTVSTKKVLQVDVVQTIGGGNAAAGLTGAAVPTSADYVGFNSSGNLIGVSSINPLPITGPLTDTQLRAVALPVSGTFFQTTQPISVVALPLPSGAATSGNQTTEIASLASIDGKLRSQTTSLTASSPTAASVTTSTGLAVASNSNRKGLVLTNTSSTEKISFGIGASAVLNSGITLTPYGVWVMDAYTFTTAAINAIASAAANLAIQELT